MAFLSPWVYIYSARLDNAQGFSEVCLPNLIKTWNVYPGRSVNLKKINSEIYGEILARDFPVRLIADSLSKTMSARRQWDDLVKMLKEEDLPI